MGMGAWRGTAQDWPSAYILPPRVWFEDKKRGPSFPRSQHRLSQGPWRLRLKFSYHRGRSQQPEYPAKVSLVGLTPKPTLPHLGLGGRVCLGLGG